jgi:phosphatidylserine/phosphatidylglycerophosphate/cardiolipin synthase-like enzyme
MTNKWLKLFPDASINNVDYFVDGYDAFKSIAEAIDSAKTQDHYIYILGWMIDIDFPLTLFRTLFHLLSGAADRGVEIRILIWNNSSPEMQKMNLDAIPRLNKLATVKAFLDDETFATPETYKFMSQIAPFIMRQLSRFLPIYKELDRFYAVLRHCITKNVGSHHDKVVIVKGEKGLSAFCGGIDLNRNRFNYFTSKYTTYHDTHCKVQGPAANQILDKFKRRWANHPAAKKFPLKGANESLSPGFTANARYAKVVGTYNDPNSTYRDRSFREAYLKIIDNAEKYIYIEDQYLVNVEVASHLNQKIKESNFSTLILAIQDSKETQDILIPDRKRGDFWNALLKDTSQLEKDKVSLVLIDAANAKKGNYHAGLHAKTLIVDDELAIIGSGNVNRRSFTHDSETSVIIFDRSSAAQPSFAKELRMKIWKEFASNTALPDSVIASWEQYAKALMNSSGHRLRLIPYFNSIEDLDRRIISEIKKMGVIAPVIANYIVGSNTNLSTALANTSMVLSPFTIVQFFDNFWEYVVDPEVK